MPKRCSRGLLDGLTARQNAALRKYPTGAEQKL
jgi:hypothetical protein